MRERGFLYYHSETLKIALVVGLVLTAFGIVLYFGVNDIRAGTIDFYDSLPCDKVWEHMMNEEDLYSYQKEYYAERCT